MRHFKTPSACASRYPASAARNCSGGRCAIAERTVASGRKCSSTPSTTSAAIHRKAMTTQPRALRRVWSAAIMKGKSQPEGYRKTRRISLRAHGCRVRSPTAALNGSTENFVDFAGELEIQIADSLYAVRVQIDHDFVPHVEPFGMVIHRFRHQRDAGHLPERGHEVLARKFPMQLAIHKRPALVRAEAFTYFRFRQFFRCRHDCLQEDLGLYLSSAQTKLAALLRSPVLSYFATLG